MTEELYWLTLTILMTALFWLPYVLNRMMVRGLMGAMANPSSDDKPEAAWAIRAHAAHNNAVENLVLFAPLVLATQILGVGTPLTATMCMVYFLARLAHYVIYLMGIPVARTLAFAIAFIAEIVLALNLLVMM